MTSTLGRRRSAAYSGAAALVVAGCAAALLTGGGDVQRTAQGAPAVDLAGTQPYAVLAHGAVRGAGTATVTGDVGGASVDGLAGRVGGLTKTGDETAAALADLAAADDGVASAPVTGELTTLTGTLEPGTYGFSGAVDLTGPVVLDAGGDGDATFILKTDAAFTADSGAAVTLAGGARACNVFWLAGGTATLGGTLVGTVFARSGIAAQPGAQVTGRLLARGGDITLDGAGVRLPRDCGGAPPGLPPVGAEAVGGPAAAPAPDPGPRVPPPAPAVRPAGAGDQRHAPPVGTRTGHEDARPAGGDGAHDRARDAARPGRTAPEPAARPVVVTPAARPADDDRRDGDLLGGTVHLDPGGLGDLGGLTGRHGAG